MHPLLICLFKERRHLKKKIVMLSFRANILGSLFVGTASIKPEIGESK